MNRYPDDLLAELGTQESVVWADDALAGAILHIERNALAHGDLDKNGRST
jgi:hypothetical protein